MNNDEANTLIVVNVTNVPPFIECGPNEIDSSRRSKLLELKFQRETRKTTSKQGTGTALRRSVVTN